MCDGCQKKRQRQYSQIDEALRRQREADERRKEESGQRISDAIRKVRGNVPKRP